MISSRSFALAGLAALLSATPAGASGCPYITDPAGDTNPLYAALATPGHDIVAAGVQVDPTTLTTVVEVDDLVPPGPLGETTYHVRFDVDGSGRAVLTSVHVTPGGVSGSVSATRYTPFFGGGIGTENTYARATATADWAADRVRLTVPLSALPSWASLPPGTLLSDVHASSVATPGTVATPDAVPAQLAATPESGPGMDIAWTSLPYLAGDPGCV